MRAQETPLAKTDTKDKGRRRVHTVQQAGDTLAWRLDGLAPDTEGAPHPIHEESQGSRG